MQSLAVAQWKRTRAVELALEGRSYDEIAREVGFSHRGSAHRAVYKALAERQVEAVDGLRQMELERLDRLQQAVWDNAMDGDLASVTAILRIIDQRIRLLGLHSGIADGQAGPTTLVVGPIEGNPGEATG